MKNKTKKTTSQKLKTRLTFLVEAERRRLSRGVGGGVGESGHGDGGRVPGVVTWPPLTVEQTQLVVHGPLTHHLLVLRGQVPQHTVYGRHLQRQ